MAEFSERLKEALKIRNISAAELSRLSKVNEGAISQYKKGAYKATQENLDRLAKTLNVSIAWLMGADVPMNKPEPKADLSSIPGIFPVSKMKQVPRLGTIACGEPILAEQNIENYDLIEADINCDFTLVCKGDSMINARIFDGDIVYIRQQADVDNGDIAAVLIDNEATLKKVYKQKDRLILRACNPLYEDFVYEGEQLNNIHILGKAICFKSFIRHSER